MRKAGFGSAIFMAVCLISLGGALPAATQEYPVKVIMLPEPFPSGGWTGLAGHRLGETIPQILKQPVIGEKRAGSAGAIGIRAVRIARPDGGPRGGSGMGPSAESLALGPDIRDNPANLACRGQMGSTALLLGARTDLDASLSDAGRRSNLLTVQDLGMPGDKNNFWSVRIGPKGWPQTVIDETAAALSAAMPNITRVPEVSHENSLAGIPDERAGCSPGAGTAHA